MITDKQTTGNAARRTRTLRDLLDAALQNISEGDIEAVLRKTMELAKVGNVAAMRLWLRHFAPPRRREPVKCDVPPLRTVEDVLAAMQAVADDVAAGKLTAHEGSNLAKIFHLFLQAFGYLDLEKRVRALRQRQERPESGPPRHS
jgi:hypothetical protein